MARVRIGLLIAALAAICIIAVDYYVAFENRQCRYCIRKSRDTRYRIMINAANKQQSFCHADFSMHQHALQPVAVHPTFAVRSMRVQMSFA
jgi:hypothetical protein